MKMKDKVYIVLLSYKDYLNDELYIMAVTKDKNKAYEKLKTIAEDECKTSWISDYDQEDLDRFDFTENYFGAKYDDKLTEIWIEEKEIED
jgi:hypothetical protein